MPLISTSMAYNSRLHALTLDMPRKSIIMAYDLAFWCEYLPIWRNTSSPHPGLET
jgi:hypothetical protein